MSDHANDCKRSPDDAGSDGNVKSGESCTRPERHHGHGGECDGLGWWEERSLAQKIMMGTGFAILGIGLAFLFGWIVMLLWNWLMPEIFGLKRVTYWQAWGLLILCHILFKGFGSGHSSVRSDRKRRRQLRRYLREDQAAMPETQAGE